MRRHLCVETVRVTLMTALGLLGGCGGTVQNTGDRHGGDASEEGMVAGGDDGSVDVVDGSDTGPESGIGEGGVTETGVAESGISEAEAGDTCRACQNPTPVVIGGVDTGYDSCVGGYMRRRAQVMCPSLLPRPGNGSCSQMFDATPAGCSSDSDCASDPYGHCELTAPDAGIPTSCECVHGCRADSDCGNNMVCVCANPIGYCAGATCSTNASCSPAGCDCISSSIGSACAATFDCQTLQDQCASPADCPQQGLGAECSENAGVHTCGPYNYCGVGRPFLVAGDARLASTMTRADWRAAGITPNVSRLSPSERRSLGDHWMRVAQMEHASIAAFARFTLHLLALGAPSELLVASNRAMADETEHARLAFSLASALLGREVGPGTLAIDGSLDAAELDAFVVTLLREGCIGETRAAVEAREMLGIARDPAVRDVLETIARDETRHAELAWRTLAWLLSSGRVRASNVRAELERAISEMGPGEGDVASRIIRPCTESLLAG